MRHASLVTSVAVALAIASTATSAAPRVVEAGRVHTMDPARPVAEAFAFDDATGRILATGTRAALRAQYADAPRIDLSNRTVVPGLIDAHGHILGLGLSLLRANLVGAASKAEVIERLKAFERELPADAWLIGRGWDQNDWPEKTFPTAADLDAAFPDRPVWLERVDGHASWANTAAMKRAKRDLAGDWQPDGGRIERAGGQPTGVFVDAAAALIDEVVPQPTEEVLERALDRAFAEILASGITSVHDMGVSRGLYALYRKRADEGRLPIRIYALADGASAALDDLCANGLSKHAGGRLEMRAVKLYADGALGSRGAALHADYSDDAGNRGLLVTEPKALAAAIDKAAGCKVQVATHAIGDRANTLVLDDYAKHLGGGARSGASSAERASNAADDRRWRIEHAQVIASRDFDRFASLGVIASMQPTHATSDMPWAEDRVGPDRILGAYAWRTLRDRGVQLAFGSDFPVEAVSPLLGLHAAMTRQDPTGQPARGWYPAQNVSAHEALRGFTRDAAYAAFAENELGVIAPGARADFTVFENDLLAPGAGNVSQWKPLETWVDGKRADAGGAKSAPTAYAPPAGDARAASAPGDASRLPAELVDGRWFVTATTRAGEALRFFTDTAGGTWIYDIAASRLGVEPVEVVLPENNAAVIDFPALAASANLPPLDAKHDPRMAELRGKLVVRTYGPQIGDPTESYRDGMLGQEWFAGRRWVFDYPAGALRLAPRALDAKAAHVVKLGMPAQGSAFASMDASIAGRTHVFLFDTGATVRLTDGALATLADGRPAERATSFVVASVFDAWRAANPSWRVIEDADAHVADTPMIEVPRVEIAGHAVGPVWFTRRADENFHGVMAKWMDRRPDGALGGNAFASLVVTADYPSRLARFERG